MAKRFMAIWFRHLLADWTTRRHPALKHMPFVLAAPERGRVIVKAVNAEAQAQGIYPNMVVADCRAILPGLQVFVYKPEQGEQILQALAEWCIRFTPVVSVDYPDGLILDISGCPHLWGSEQAYLQDINKKLSGFGYHIRVAIADTAGTAWAVSRYAHTTPIIPPGQLAASIVSLPPAALRLEPAILERLNKLGLQTVGSFMKMPRQALRRRFGQVLLSRLDQALGQEIEAIHPVHPIEPYQERLPSLEPIRTATGIAIALEQLTEKLCTRLAAEEKGLRRCVFKCYRIDGNIRQIEIGTNRPSRNVAHLLKLFDDKIVQIEPDLGIELFILEAPVVEELPAAQEAIWQTTGCDDKAVAELLDKVTGKFGINAVHRYLPNQSHWPERSVVLATSLQDKPSIAWRDDLPRPVNLLPQPKRIEVMVQMPDYPPVLFHYNGKAHYISKADGPERLEQEWWLSKGLYRDYYCVEDQDGARYWLFRSGPYHNQEPKWFLHGFFL